MKHLFLTLSLSALFTLNSIAQTDSLSKTRRFQVGVNFSSDYCYRILKKNYGDEMTESIIQMRDTLESPKFGYTTGINSCFNFNQHIGIELGVQYSNKGYQIKDITFVTANNPEGAGTAHIFYNHHYIDVPLKANFTFGKNNIQFIGSAGFAANIFLLERDKSVLRFSDHTETHHFNPETNYEPVNLSAQMSAGISYKINNRMSVRLEPTIRYGLTDIIDQTPITARFYNAGVNVGYYMSF